MFPSLLKDLQVDAEIRKGFFFFFKSRSELYPELPSVLSDLNVEILAPPKRRAKFKASSHAVTKDVPE